MISKETVIQFRDGEAAAFEVIYASYKERLMNYCQTMVVSKESAEELVHDIFLQLWKSRSRLDEDRPIGPYLNTIARNMTLNWLKAAASQKKRRQSLEQAYALERDLSNDRPAIIPKMDLDILEQQLEQMPLQRRLIFRMCKFQEMTYAEVANTLSLSRKTVENQMTLANKQFADLANARDYLYMLLLISILIIR